MGVELSLEQPEAVAEAIAALVSTPVRLPDPWWRAGLDESLAEAE